MAQACLFLCSTTSWKRRRDIPDVGLLPSLQRMDYDDDDFAGRKLACFFAPQRSGKGRETHMIWADSLAFKE